MPTGNNYTARKKDYDERELSNIESYDRAFLTLSTSVFTDEHKGYSGLLRKDFEHGTVNHSAKEFINGMAPTNGIESVWAVLKRGYNGVYHNWSRKHMRQYINEFSLRLNEGSCKVDTEDRLKSLFGAMAGKTTT